MADQRPLINKLQQQIQDILFKHDPVGLGSFGAPKDEYSPESQTIAPRLVEGMSVEAIADMVYEEFVKWFDKKLVGNREKYTDIARDMVQLLRENNAQ